MDHLKNLLAGAAGLFRHFEPRPYPPYEGFSADARNMRSDWKTVGSDLRSSLKAEAKERKDDKPTNPR